VSTETNNARDLKAVIGVHDADQDTAVPDVAPIAFGGNRRSAAEDQWDARAARP